MPKNTSKRSGPGRIEGENSVILHTRQGMALFDGRPANPEKGKSAIYGVPRFYGAVKQIYFDAMADDPWADWWLIKVDHAIEKAQQSLEQLRAEIQGFQPRNASISISNAHSVQPEPRPLNFAIPSYPHRMAYIVTDCDLMTLDVLNLFHAGLMTRQQKERLVHKIGKVARGALTSATGFRHCGVTRNDVMANNPKARKAKELMGEVPEDVLNLKLRSDYAPELRQYNLDEAGSGQEERLEQDPQEPVVLKEVSQG